MNRERLKQGIQETLSLTYRVNGSINLELDVSNGGTLRSCLLHRFIVTFLFVKVATWPNDDVHVSVKTLRIKTSHCKPQVFHLKGRDFIGPSSSVNLPLERWKSFP